MSILLFILVFAPRKHPSINLLPAVILRLSLQHDCLLYYFHETIPRWMRFFPPIYLSSSVVVVFLDSGIYLLFFFIINSEKKKKK